MARTPAECWGYQEMMPSTSAVALPVHIVGSDKRHPLGLEWHTVTVMDGSWRELAAETGVSFFLLLSI